MRDCVLRLPDGTPRIVRQPIPPTSTVITPGNADAVGAALDQERREWENKPLIDAYGEDECKSTGIIP